MEAIAKLLITRRGKPAHAIVDADIFPKARIYNWSVNNRGYASARVGGLVVFLHRFVLNYDGPLTIDHINRDKLDCRRVNLRIVTQGVNCLNARMSNRNTSGFKGVSWHKRGRKWQAQIKISGRPLHLGLFPTIEAAVEARQMAETLYCPMPLVPPIPQAISQ